VRTDKLHNSEQAASARPIFQLPLGLRETLLEAEASFSTSHCSRIESEPGVVIAGSQQENSGFSIRCSESNSPPKQSRPLPEPLSFEIPSSKPGASISGDQGGAPIPFHLTRQQLQFLLRVAPPALESERIYEIPACVTMAQAILESATPKFGWGSSSLFRLANNPFGIKYAHFGAGGSGLGKTPTFGIRHKAP
jgi:flagellum-specific peptidoglycan hydrolase FlgJ